MSFFDKLWEHWPKIVRFEIHDGDCNLLDVRYGTIYSYNEIMDMGSKYAQEAMRKVPNENQPDECYWRYEVLR